MNKVNKSIMTIGYMLIIAGIIYIGCTAGNSRYSSTTDTAAAQQQQQSSYIVEVSSTTTPATIDLVTGDTLKAYQADNGRVYYMKPIKYNHALIKVNESNDSIELLDHWN